MARPKKEPGEKKTERLTLYFTPGESERLNIISESMTLDKTKVIGKALEQYVKTLEDPPQNLRKASYEQIMQQDKEKVNGYICAQGHTFWLEWVWPAPPLSCPCCGEKNIKSTWAGIVKKGF